MDRTIHAEKGHLDPDHLEVVLDDTARGQATYYRPQNDEERKLDRKVNFKLDCWVVSLLAIEFIVSNLLTQHGCAPSLYQCLALTVCSSAV